MTSCSTHSRLQLRRSLPISWHSESKIQRTKERENPSQSNFQNKHCRVPTIYEYSERTRLCQDIWRFIFPWQYAATTWQIILTHHHFWQAPLRARSTERGHQSPEWMVLSQVNCVVHIKVAGFQILLNGFHPCNTRTSQWSPPVSCGGSC